MSGVTDIENMSSEEFARSICKTVAREYGPAGLLRFLEEQVPKQGNYMESRKQWVNDMTLDEIFDEVEQLRAEKRS